MHAERAVGPLALDVAAAGDLAQAGRYAQHHVHERRRLDQPEVDGIPGREVEHLALAQIGRDVVEVELALQLVGQQNQQDVRAPDRLGDAHHLEAVVARGIRVAVLDVADDDVQPGVAQVLRLRVALAAIAQGRDQLALQVFEIGVLRQVERVTPGLRLLHSSTPRAVAPSRQLTPPHRAVNAADPGQSGIGAPSCSSRSCCSSLHRSAGIGTDNIRALSATSAGVAAPGITAATAG